MILGVYWSYDTVKEGSVPSLHGDVLADYLAMLAEPGIPPHRLCLKVGAICTVMRNLSLEKGLVKNTRVIIQQLQRYSVVVRVLSLNPALQTAPVTIPVSRITFEFNPHRSNWTVQRRQFPFRLAYAATFNSSQGLTLERVLYDFQSDAFAHGQLYTALTRIRHRSHGRALYSSQKGNQVTVN